MLNQQAKSSEKDRANPDRSIASKGDFVVIKVVTTGELEDEIRSYCDPTKPFQFFIIPNFVEKYKMVCIGR